MNGQKPIVLKPTLIRFQKMRKKIKRKPDLRKVRRTHVYTFPEIASDLNRKLSTVHRWKNDGMPTLEDSNASLVDGEELHAWLSAKWSSKKRPCGDGELYCCKCKVPRAPTIGSVRLEPRTNKTITIKGKCSVCGTPQSQTGSLAKLDKYQSNFNLPTQAVQHLSVCTNPCVSDNIISFSKHKPKEELEEVQLSMHEHLETDDKQSGS